MSFINDKMVAFADSLTEHAIFSLNAVTTADITLPVATAATGMGVLGGSTGYMTLGLGAKTKSSLLTINE